MGDTTAPTSAVTTIAAIATPALFILASASLVASALVRMARVVDRARSLAVIAHEGSWEKFGLTPDILSAWLARHAERARYAERSIALLYAAVVVFIVTALSIALDRTSGEMLGWLSISLTIVGTLLLLGGGAFMVAESRLSGTQIQEEIHNARIRLEEKTR